MEQDAYVEKVTQALTEPFKYLSHLLWWARNTNRKLDDKWNELEQILPAVRFWRTQKEEEDSPKKFVCLELITPNKSYMITFYENKRLFFIFSGKGYFHSAEELRKGKRYIEIPLTEAAEAMMKAKPAKFVKKAAK